MRSTSRLLAAMAILTMACSDETPSDPERLRSPENGAGCGSPRAIRTVGQTLPGDLPDTVVPALP